MPQRQFTYEDRIPNYALFLIFHWGGSQGLSPLSQNGLIDGLSLTVMSDEEFSVNDLSTTWLSENAPEILHRTRQTYGAENTEILSPSKDAYGAFIFLFDYFNHHLFKGTLPNCLITLPQGRRSVRGYFCEKSWTKTKHGDVCDEIALNPIYFQDNSTERVLSTLVHEMVHLQQFHFYKPGKSGYHNKEWGRLMRKVGLIPSSTGKPGGDEIGRRVSHYIDEGGSFQHVCQELLQTGFAIPWHVISPTNEEDENDDDDNLVKKKRESKTKYTCPDCDLNAWAKPNVFILCGTCQQELMTAAS